jgi:flagellar protein FliL
MATNPVAPSAAAPRFTPKLIMALALCIVLVFAGAATLFYVLRGELVHAAPAAQEVKPIFVTLEPLTVNLQSEGKPRFLHLGISLKVKDEHAQARISESTPELRSRLLLLLSNRDPATLLAPADKTALAEEIKRDLNGPLAAGAPAQGITGVAFNTFVVQ